MAKVKGTGKLINKRTGQIECQVCRQVWFANTRRGYNGFEYNSFVCPNGCTEEDLKK